MWLNIITGKQNKKRQWSIMSTDKCLILKWNKYILPVDKSLKIIILTTNFPTGNGDNWIIMQPKRLPRILVNGGGEKTTERFVAETYYVDLWWLHKYLLFLWALKGVDNSSLNPKEIHCGILLFLRPTANRMFLRSIFFIYMIYGTQLIYFIFSK